MRQLLMFPDPRPLVERLGRAFFRELPTAPGVYLMRDAADTVLYVGKAKNLRHRLNAYRVANPDRMARRHLRMLRAVVRIELELCADESAALARESELLLSLRPRYNRAGTWRGPPRFLLWREAGQSLEMAVAEAADSAWRNLGPLGSRAFVLRSVLLRLAWFATHADRGFQNMPHGWIHGRFENPSGICTGPETSTVARALEELLSGDASPFCDWVQSKVPPNLHPFQKTLFDENLEWLTTHFALPGPRAFLRAAMGNV